MQCWKERSNDNENTTFRKMSLQCDPKWQWYFACIATYYPGEAQANNIETISTSWITRQTYLRILYLQALHGECRGFVFDLTKLGVSLVMGSSLREEGRTGLGSSSQLRPLDSLYPCCWSCSHWSMMRAPCKQLSPVNHLLVGSVCREHYRLSWGKSLGWSKWPLRCTWFQMWGDLPGWGWWTGWPLMGSRAYWWRLLPQLEHCSMWIIWVSVYSDHQVKNGHTCRSRMQYVQRWPLASGEGQNLVGRVSMKPWQVHQLMAPWKCDTLPRVWVTSMFERRKMNPTWIHS